MGRCWYNYLRLLHHRALQIVFFSSVWSAVQLSSSYVSRKTRDRHTSCPGLWWHNAGMQCRNSGVTKKKAWGTTEHLKINAIISSHGESVMLFSVQDPVVCYVFWVPNKLFFFFFFSEEKQSVLLSFFFLEPHELIKYPCVTKQCFILCLWHGTALHKIHVFCDLYLYVCFNSLS